MNNNIENWFNRNSNLQPEILLNRYAKEFKGTVVDIVKLGVWVHDKFPKNHIPLQDRIWSHLKTLGYPNLQNFKAYHAYCSRVSKPYSIDPKLIADNETLTSLVEILKPKSNFKFNNRENREPLTSEMISEQWRNIFKDVKFEKFCLDVFGHIPEYRLRLADMICLTFNLLSFKLSTYYYPEELPEDIKFKSTNILLDLENIFAPKFYKNSDFQKKISKEEYISKVSVFFSRLKEGVFAKKHSKRKSLEKYREYINKFSEFLLNIFEFKDRIGLINHTIKPAFLEQLNEKKLETKKIYNSYIDASLNLTKYLTNIMLGDSTVHRLLLDFKNLFTSIKNENKKTKLNNKNIIKLYFKLHESYQSLVNLYIERDSQLNTTNNELNHKNINKNYLQTRHHRLEILFRPYFLVLNNLKNVLSSNFQINKNSRDLLIPKTQKLQVNLQDLLFNKINALKSIDHLNFMIKKQPFSNLNIDHKKCLFTDDSNNFIIKGKLQLNNLIARLHFYNKKKLFESGDVMEMFVYLKHDLDFYLEKLIESTLNELEWILEISEKYFDGLKSGKITLNQSKEILISNYFSKLSTGAGKVLESLAWLQNYFKKQKPHYKNNVFNKVKPEINKNEEKIKKDLDIKIQSPSTTKISSFESNQQARTNPTNTSAIKTNVQQAGSKNTSFSKQTHSTKKLDNLKPVPHNPSITSGKERETIENRTQLWKKKVEEARKLKTHINSLKRINKLSRINQPTVKADDDTLNCILRGVLRRKDPSDLHDLQKLKMKDLLPIIQNEGWREVRIKGDHHIYQHASLKGSIPIPYSKKNQTLAKSTFNSIAKALGWK